MIKTSRYDILESDFEGNDIMANLHIDFTKIINKIKPMHAVGQPPFRGGFQKLDFSPMQILKDANIPYSRLHDVGGAFGGYRYVDIPNIFRNFDADETKPESYDFAFTDALLAGMAQYGIKPYFRLGVTIENQSFIKAYHIHPPKDYEKWARICEHIVRHYNEGWADGYHYGIEYWEIWNEPDNRPDPKLNQMWTGSPEEYYALYDVTAKHLKKCFGDSIKVGGYAATGFYGIFAAPDKYKVNVEKRTDIRYTGENEAYRMKFFFGFMDYIKKHNSPMDFFSWHCYLTADVTSAVADFVDIVLTEYGYGHVETHLNEWNNSHELEKNRTTSYASANIAATMCAMQNKKTDMLMYYDAKYWSTGAYGGFYDLAEPKTSFVYSVFEAFGKLYALGNQAKCECDTEGVYALAATDGNEKAILITNISDSDVNIETELKDKFEAFVIDKDHCLTPEEIDTKNFVIKSNRVMLIKS